jgi:hypothetical protein
VQMNGWYFLGEKLVPMVTRIAERSSFGQSSK